ncbi:MAG: GNAT family N-acetyltransferase [Gemmatimonadetes bacterium]|nr:GNAT family N-acetyltransferase [Gemmatimonadota bacterium]
MHNLALATPTAIVPARAPWRRRPPTLALFDAQYPMVRAAHASDVEQIVDLVGTFAPAGLMLPRSAAQVARELDHYVVAADAMGHVLACASLTEYSPSLAEVASVAVAPSQHGKGLGSLVVQGVEAVAATRQYQELFALSLQDGFFGALGYELADVNAYPEKLAQWARLKREGVDVLPKRCFRKVLA